MWIAQRSTCLGGSFSCARAGAPDTSVDWPMEYYGTKPWRGFERRILVAIGMRKEHVKNTLILPSCLSVYLSPANSMIVCSVGMETPSISP